MIRLFNSCEAIQISLACATFASLDARAWAQIVRSKTHVMC
jgi:hypothetical protein